MGVSVWIDSPAAPFSSAALIDGHLDLQHRFYWWSAVNTGQPVLNLRFIFVD